MGPRENAAKELRMSEGDIVIPAKVGIPLGRVHRSWTPAFAGVTDGVEPRMSEGRYGHSRDGGNLAWPCAW